MVTATYTDNTQIQQAPSLNLGSGSEALAGAAAAKANLIHNTTKYVTDKIQKQTDIAAEEAGAKEGMKGQKAKPWSNLFEAGRAFNKGLAQTAPLMIGNDLTKYFSQEWNSVRQSNYSKSSYNDFTQKTSAYLKQYTELTPAHLRPAVAQAGIRFMGNYQTQFGKGFLNAQVENNQLQSRMRINTDINNVAIQTRDGHYDSDPKGFSDNVKRVFAVNNAQTNLTALQRFNSNKTYTDTAMTGIMQNMYGGWITSYERAKNSNNPNTAAFRERLEHFHRNPDELVKRVVLSQEKLTPEFKNFVDMDKLSVSARKITNQFKVKTAAINHDLQTTTNNLINNMGQGIAVDPMVYEDATHGLSQNNNSRELTKLTETKAAFDLVNQAKGNNQLTQDLLMKANQGKLGFESKFISNLITHNQKKSETDNGLYNQDNFLYSGGLQAFNQYQYTKGRNPKEVRYTVNAAMAPNFLTAIGTGSTQLNPEILQDLRYSLQNQFNLNPNHNASFKSYTNQQLTGLARLLHDSNSQARNVEIFTNLHNAGIDTEELFGNLNMKGNNEQNSRTMYAAWNPLTSGSYLEKNIINQAAADKEFGLVDNKYKGHLAVNSTRVRQLLENSFPPAQAKILLNSVKQIAGAIHNGDEVGSLGAGVVHSRANIWQDMFGSASYDSGSLYKIGLNILRVYGKHPVPGYDVIAPAEARNPLDINSKANITHMDSLQNFFTETIKNGKFYAGEHPTLGKEALADLLTGRVINPVTDFSLLYRAVGGVIATAANMNPHVINDGGSGWRLVTDGGAQIFYDIDGKQGKPVKKSFFDTFALINKHKG